MFVQKMTLSAAVIFVAGVFVFEQHCWVCNNSVTMTIVYVLNLYVLSE
jgi:hypothetical protein